jgi:imidazole glycerol-phosphate synthase subunit HisH
MNRVTVVDYGVGNLHSVARALERCGATPVLADDGQAIERADRLLLPGVGAFGDGMRGLRERGLVDPILRFAASGRPLLGICLGMQMLLERSFEFGHHEGLGLIPGSVVALPAHDTDGLAQRIPHIGWSALRPGAPDRDWRGTVLDGVTPRGAVYFVHSFMAVPADPEHRLAETVYGGHPVVAAIAAGNVVGCQFHPEKSGQVGLDILARFAGTLAPDASDDGRDAAHAVAQAVTSDAVRARPMTDRRAVS